MESVIIVGAGTAGVYAASWLRQHGFEGRVTLLSAETVAPYRRPPLSKAFLAAGGAAQATPLKPEPFFEQNRIQLDIGAKVVEIDRARSSVVQGGRTPNFYDFDLIERPKSKS